MKDFPDAGASCFCFSSIQSLQTQRVFSTEPLEISCLSGPNSGKYHLCLSEKF